MLIRKVANLINDGHSKIVVLSAMSGTTNALVEIANYLYKKNHDGANEVINKLEQKYYNEVDALYTTAAYKTKGAELIKSHFDFIKCEKWKTGCFSCPQKNEYPTSLFLDSSKRNYEDKRRLFTSVKNMTLISPSQWLAEFAKQSFLKKYKTEVINNGIDLETFKPLNQGKFRKDNNLENRFVVLGVASKWEERKGLEFFVSLSEKIVENTKIVLVGLNDKQIVGLPKSILTIKRTDSVQELAEIYSTADVFVNPTMEDTFPTTNLEALACGTPVVTFDTGGSPESIDEKTGYIVERGNTDLLLEKIQSVREKGKAAYTANCVNRAKAKYGKTDRFAEYLACYKNILG